MRGLAAGSIWPMTGSLTPTAQSGEQLSNKTNVDWLALLGSFLLPFIWFSFLSTNKYKAVTHAWCCLISYLAGNRNTWKSRFFMKKIISQLIYEFYQKQSSLTKFTCWGSALLCIYYLTMNQVYWIMLTYSTDYFVFPLFSYKSTCNYM